MTTKKALLWTLALLLALAPTLGVLADDEGADTLNPLAGVWSWFDAAVGDLMALLTPEAGGEVGTEFEPAGSVGGVGTGFEPIGEADPDPDEGSGVWEPMGGRGSAAVGDGDPDPGTGEVGTEFEPCG